MIMRLEPSSPHRGIRPGIPSDPLHLLAVSPYRPPYSVHGLHRLLLPRRLDQRYDNHREGFRQLLQIAAQNRHFQHREARELDLAEAFPFVVVGVDPVGPVVDGGEEFRGCVADCDGGVCEAEAVARGVCEAADLKLAVRCFRLARIAAFRASVVFLGWVSLAISCSVGLEDGGA